MSTMVELRHDRGEHLDGGMGLDGCGGLGAGGMDHLDGALKLIARGGLCVHGDDIGARFEEPRQLLKRVRDHEMHVERHVGNLLQLLDHGHAPW